MNLNGGYVKLFRKTLDSRVFRNAELFKVWVWCLLKANHKEEWVTIKTGKGETEVKVGPGQFVYGRKSASKELVDKPSNIRNRIEKLKNIGNIAIQPDTHYSIITIVNWDTYQQQPQKEDSKEDRHRTGTGQPEDTNKNDKNAKKEKPFCAEQESSPPEPPKEIFISILLKDGSEFGVDMDFLSKLINLHPCANVKQELMRMQEWCLNNPRRRKTKGGVKTFINGWLKRSLDGNKQQGAGDVYEELRRRLESR